MNSKIIDEKIIWNRELLIFIINHISLLLFWINLFTIKLIGLKIWLQNVWNPFQSNIFTNKENEELNNYIALYKYCKNVAANSSFYFRPKRHSKERAKINMRVHRLVYELLLSCDINDRTCEYLRVHLLIIHCFSLCI